jgi:predicted secreted protein
VNIAVPISVRKPLAKKNDIGTLAVMSDKTPARRAADARFEAARTPVLVRFKLEEIEAIDRVRGSLSRPQYVKAMAVRAAARKGKQ